MQSPQLKKRGFTLVELLAVIAIISVIVAMVVPSLTGAIARARSTECKSKLRNLHIAFTNYIDDNDGRMPNFNQYDGNGHFYYVISDYVAPHRDANLSTCPVAFRNAGGRPGDMMAVSYGYNAGIGYLHGKEGRAIYTELKNPAMTVMLMDGSLAWPSPNPYWYWEVVANPGASRRPKPSDFVHNEKANMIFCDGHIESRENKDVPTRGNDIFWNPRGMRYDIN